MFSLWSSINALPQNSYEPAGLFHSPGCELLSAFPPTHLLVVFIARGSGSLSPDGPQTPQLLSLSFGWGPPPCRGRLVMLKSQTWRRKAARRLVFHQAEGSVPRAHLGQDQVKLLGSGRSQWTGKAAGFGMLQGLQEDMEPGLTFTSRICFRSREKFGTCQSRGFSYGAGLAPCNGTC